MKPADIHTHISREMAPLEVRHEFDVDCTARAPMMLHLFQYPMLSSVIWHPCAGGTVCPHCGREFTREAYEARRKVAA